MPVNPEVSEYVAAWRAKGTPLAAETTPAMLATQALALQGEPVKKLDASVIFAAVWKFISWRILHDPEIGFEDTRPGSRKFHSGEDAPKKLADVVGDDPAAAGIEESQLGPDPFAVEPSPFDDYVSE